MCRFHLLHIYVFAYTYIYLFYLLSSFEAASMYVYYIILTQINCAQIQLGEFNSQLRITIMLKLFSFCSVDGKQAHCEYKPLFDGIECERNNSMTNEETFL